LLIVKGTYALLVEDVVIVLKSSKVFTFCLLLKCLVGFLSFFRPVFFFFFFGLVYFASYESCVEKICFSYMIALEYIAIVCSALKEV
jgi:hypothetical protein